MGESTALKPVEVRSFAYGTVHITDISTTAPSDGRPQSSSNEARVAWHVYRISQADGEGVQNCMYLPAECLMYNGSYVQLTVNAAVGRKDAFGFCTLSAMGQISCSVYEENGDVKAELRTGPRAGALFTFVVCEMNGGSGGISVQQYISGTVVIFDRSGNGPFQPKFGENGVIGFEDGYIQVGGKTVHVSGSDRDPSGNEFVAVKVPATTNGGTPSIEYYSDLSALNAAQEDIEFVVVPIYRLAEVSDSDDSDSDSDSGEVTVIDMDLRQMPSAQLAEVL